MGHSREHTIEKRWGRRVAALREKRGLTQDQLAEALTLRSDGYPWTQSVVSRIELAKRPIYAVEMLDLSRVFGITIEQLVSEKDDPDEPDTHQREMELDWLRSVIDDRLAALQGDRPHARRRRLEAARRMGAAR